MNINGFKSKDSQARLYQFLARWEKYAQENDNSEVSLIDAFPKLQVIKNQLKLFKSQRATIEKKKAVVEDGFFWMSDGKTIAHFIKHVRNSIAHCYISKSNGYVTIIDYRCTNNRTRKISCFGRIGETAFNQIVDAIIAD